METISHSRLASILGASISSSRAQCLGVSPGDPHEHLSLIGREGAISFRSRISDHIAPHIMGKRLSSLIGLESPENMGVIRVVPGVAVRRVFEHRGESQKSTFRVCGCEASPGRDRAPYAYLRAVLPDTTTVRRPLPRRGRAGPANDCRIFRGLPGGANLD